jgi:hypothetical protein
MSYDFIMYMRRNDFPEAGRLAEELRPFVLTMPMLDLRLTDGFVPVSDAGFEVSCSDVTARDIEEHQNALREAGEPDDEHIAILRASDMCMSFGCRDDREIRVAKLVAGAIAKLSKGFVCDPQTGEVAHGDYLSS